MCSNNATNVNMLPYGLRVPNPAPLLPLLGGMGQTPLDFHRAQVYDYSGRLNLQFALRGYPTMSPYHPMGNSADPFRHLYLYAKHDPRANFMHEEPKPSQSYIGLIAMAILSVPDKKMVLSDIYQYILDHYPYFRTRGPGWRNSIRHNLSLNDCFIKSGRSANGKGHYWAIHPANLEDFKKGDFRRRRAQRRVRKYLGLSVPDDEDSPSPSPTSTHQETWMEEKDGDDTTAQATAEGKPADDNAVILPNLSMTVSSITDHNCNRGPGAILENDNMRGVVQKTTGIKRRLFDMESLLAPDTDSPRAFKTFVATDLSIRREVREVREDSDTEIVVTDDRCSPSGDVTRQISVSSDSERTTLDQSGSSKSEEENEVSSTDNEQGTNGLNLNIKSWRDNKQNQVNSDAGVPRVIKIHPSSPAVVTNGLGGLPFPPHHAIPTPIQLAQQGLTWQDRPSAFQRMSNGNLSRTLSPVSYSPLMVQGRPAFPICLSTSDPVTSAQKWQETLSRIMARSYDKPVKTDS
uniref:Forkhead Q2 A n=1 Tax=Leptochiton asellus TaxID=211853 RepID=A0A0Y0H5B0_9MOLL|nr:forkhead Q2 A [Leptochiton asellus]